MNDPKEFNILLVEDDKDEFEITKRAIEKSNLSASISWASSNVDEGFKLITNTKPDLLFLDINMPDITGLNLLKKLKTDPKLSGTACYILSSSDNSSDLKEAYKVGATGYIQKPISYTDFIDLLNQFSDYWTKVCVLPSRHRDAI